MSTSPSKILFSLVARGTNVLAERSFVSGNAIQIAHRILGKLPTTDTRVSYKQDGHMYHVLVANGLAFVCMAEESFGVKIPSAFLEAVKVNFAAAYGVSAISAAAYEYNADFSGVLQQQMNYFSDEPSAARFATSEGDGPQGMAILSIDTVLEKGEHIELLVDKSNDRVIPYYHPSTHSDGLSVCDRPMVYIGGVPIPCDSLTTMQKAGLVLLIFLIICIILLILIFGTRGHGRIHYHHHHHHHHGWP